MSSSVGPKSVSSALAALSHQNGKHFIFEDQNMIGRSSRAFISITNNQISRKHCLIVKTEENKFKILDMSLRGTFVNDQRLTKNQAQELNHKDRINLAGLEEYSYVFLYNKKQCKAEIEDLKKKLEEKEIKHQQFEELQARLEETKNVLLESEMEQRKAKVEIETKLESKIVDPTSERENNEVQVKELKKKLKEKEEQEEKVKKEIAGLEDDMMCSICAEMYVEPTALNCGHMFCKLCINEWNKKKEICPMCRAEISTTVRIFNMDSVIEKNIRLMPEEARSRREAVIAERKRGKTPWEERSAKKKRRENHPRVRPEPTVSIDLAAGSPLANVNHNNRTQGSQNRTFSVADMEIESIDPFQVGWVTNPALRNVRPVGRNSPVTVADIDPTNFFEARTSARTHTVTSADANSIIDLTDI